MNTIVKLGVASAMAFGAVAAHASISLPSSGSSDLLLFAEVVNGSSVIASYGGDTGVAMPAWNGTLTTQTTNTSDAALSALFAADNTVAGDSIIYAVMGGYETKLASNGNFKTSGVANFATTGTLAAVQNTNTTNLVAWDSLKGTIGTLNTNINTYNTAHSISGNSAEAASAANAGIWDQGNTGGVIGWFGNGPLTALTQGSGAQTLYGVTGVGTTTTPVGYSSLGTVNLTAGGLQIVGTSAVPLPAAVWLLGSGLIGLAGIGRRKSSKI
jgi:hypothetical protein